jgi:hypothetical protein
MSFLVAITGVGSVLWLLIILTLGGEFADPDATKFLMVFDAIHIVLFLICLKKYRSPEYKAKQKKAQEEWAAYKAEAPERKRQREERRAIEAERRRRATTVVSARLIGASAPEYKKSVGDMAVRGAVGGLFGPAGAVIGMATAKDKNVNKGKSRFLVKYEDGHIEEKEAAVGDPLYKVYMEHLEW